MPRWVFKRCESSATEFDGTTRSLSPLIIRPDDGQGAREEKSQRLDGGAPQMKPSTSGRRIKSCIAIQVPNDTPAIQQRLASGLTICSGSSARAPSELSPGPPSQMPWLRPTPRKLKRGTEKPRSTKV